MKLGTVPIAVAVSMAAVTLAPTDWQQEVSGGLGDADNGSVSALAHFNGTLYAGTYSSMDKAEVWARVFLSDNWTWVPRQTGGFADAGNLAVSSMAAFHGITDALYLGTFNYATGCEIWFTTNGSDFDQTHSDGLGYGTANTEVKSMVVFDNRLFIGTVNGNGLQIHEFTGVTWVPRVIGGFNNETDNVSATCMVVHDGALYVGTENSNTGGEIWRSSDGVSWTRRVNLGFGVAGANSIGAMASSGGTLFAAAQGTDGVAVYAVGDPFSLQVNNDGFGSSSNTYAAAMIGYAGSVVVGTQNNTGAQVWRHNGGLSWTSISYGGFGSANNTFIPALAVLGHDLFASTSNASGAEIWVYPAVFSDDLESGGLSAWSSSAP